MADGETIFQASTVQVGDVVGTLVLLSTYFERDGNGRNRRFWICRCNVCGLERPVYSHILKSFVGKPCKCTRGTSDTPEYGIWQAMLTRCYNPKSISYPLYGARGIVVCQRWRESSNAFLIDMGQRPTDDHSIDRIDSSGGYTCGKCDECREHGHPANCRWATSDVQHRNQKSNRYYTHDDQTLVLTDWARLIGIDAETLSGRLERGWTFEKTITTPKLKTWSRAPRRNVEQKPNSPMT